MPKRYILMVTPIGNIVHESAAGMEISGAAGRKGGQHAGCNCKKQTVSGLEISGATGLEIAGLVGGGVALLALLVGIGSLPGALIAHYGFGLTWGKSIAVGVGAAMGLGMVANAIHPMQIGTSTTSTSSSALPPAPVPASGPQGPLVTLAPGQTLSLALQPGQTTAYFQLPTGDSWVSAAGVAGAPLGPIAVTPGGTLTGTFQGYSPTRQVATGNPPTTSVLDGAVDLVQWTNLMGSGTATFYYTDATGAVYSTVVTINAQPIGGVSTTLSGPVTAGQAAAAASGMPIGGSLPPGAIVSQPGSTQGPGPGSGIQNYLPPQPSQPTQPAGPGFPVPPTKLPHPIGHNWQPLTPWTGSPSSGTVQNPVSPAANGYGG